MSRSVTGKPRRLGRRGVTAVEMALVLNVLLLLLVGGVEVGRYYFVSESVTYLVGELSRAAMVNPDVDRNARKFNYLSRAPILKAAKFQGQGGALNVVVTRATAPALTTLAVTATYPHELKLPFLPTLANSVSAATTVRFAAPAP